MSKIKKVGFGYTVPKERYQEAAENIQKLGAMYAEYLQKKISMGLESKMRKSSWPTSCLPALRCSMSQNLRQINAIWCRCRERMEKHEDLHRR